jgi:hypothetical protein
MRAARDPPTSVVPPRAATATRLCSSCWRIRLVAYGARLESVLGASPRGFESPILRHLTSNYAGPPPVRCARRCRSVWSAPAKERCARPAATVPTASAIKACMSSTEINRQCRRRRHMERRSRFSHPDRAVIDGWARGAAHDAVPCAEPPITAQLPRPGDRHPHPLPHQRRVPVGRDRTAPGVSRGGRGDRRARNPRAGRSLREVAQHAISARARPRILTGRGRVSSLGGGPVMAPRRH